MEVDDGIVNTMFLFMFEWKIFVLFGYMNMKQESYEVGRDIWKYKTAVSWSHTGWDKNVAQAHEGLTKLTKNAWGSIEGAGATAVVLWCWPTDFSVSVSVYKGCFSYPISHRATQGYDLGYPFLPEWFWETTFVHVNSLLISLRTGLLMLSFGICWMLGLTEFVKFTLCEVE